jgi:hypothetical protein
VTGAAPAIRASDADRERTVAALRAHLLAGRLRADEFEDRIDRAYRSTTRDELATLTRDLGRSPAAVPARRRSVMPGNLPFAVRFTAGRPSSVVIAEAGRTLAPHLLGLHYRMEQGGSERLVFTREQRPAWAIAAAIFIPIFGLIALVNAKEVSQIVVSATQLDEHRSVVDVFGRASLRVRRAMADLEDSG